MGGKRWTPEEIRAVRAAARDGLTRAEAADEVGRTETQVRGLVNQMTLKGRPIKFRRGHSTDVELRSLIMRLVAGGCDTAVRVAEAGGLNYRAAEKMVQRLGKEGLLVLDGYGKARRLSVSPRWYAGSSDDRRDEETLRHDSVLARQRRLKRKAAKMAGAFNLEPGAEVRLATQDERTNGRLGRVVLVEPKVDEHRRPYLVVHLETNFGSGRFRAMISDDLCELEPLVVTEFVNPHANGNGKHHPNGVHTGPAPTEYIEDGTGNSCPRCGGINLERRGGGCVRCKDCRYDAGCNG